MVGNTPTVCSVSLTGNQVDVTALAAGTCSFTVTKAMDSDYLVSASLTYSITVSSAATDLTLTVKPVGKSVAGGQGATQGDRQEGPPGRRRRGQPRPGAGDCQAVRGAALHHGHGQQHGRPG